MLAYSTGRPLNVLSDDIAERTAKDWEDYKDSPFAHFEEMKKILDAKDGSYRD